MEKNQIIQILLAAGVCEEDVNFFLDWNIKIEDFAVQNPKSILWAYKNYPNLRPKIEEIFMGKNLVLETCMREIPKFGPIDVPVNVLEEYAYRAPVDALKYTKHLMSIYLRQWCRENINKKQ